VDKPWLHVTKKLFPLSIAYRNFTFQKETLAITSELAASNGKFTGYIKPLFDDIAVIDLSETNQPFEVVWESIVAGVSRVFRNQPKNRIATKIPISGTIDDQRPMFFRH
jgi:hypothetical protein